MQNKVIEYVKQYAMITLSISIMSVGVYFFKFPNNFVFGGVTGAAALAAVLAPACIIKAVLLVCQKVSFPQVAAHIVPAGCAVLGAAVLAVGMAGQVQTRIGGHESYTCLLYTSPSPRD